MKITSSRAFTVAIALAGVFLVCAYLLSPGTHPATVYSAPAIRAALTTQRYRVYTHRLEDFYRTLVSALRANGEMDLLARIEPPQRVGHGYQVLPRLLSQQKPRHRSSQPVGYSWPWTDKLIGDALEEITNFEEEIGRLPEMSRGARRQMLETAVDGYLQSRRRTQNIDAHIQYNRLWQTSIANDRSTYDRETARYYQVLERESVRQSLTSLSAANKQSAFAWFERFLDLPLLQDRLTKREALLGREIELEAIPPQTPDFVQVERHENAWIFKVPFYTDIEDQHFVQSAKEKIENIWHLRRGGEEFRVELDVIFIASAVLYGDKNTPKPGAPINMMRHLGLFPHDGAILTTGARTTHVLNHAIVLGPHDIDERILGHEFGHVLGFRDSYVRGYKDLGENGFEVLETVVDAGDIMGRSDTGAVLPAHFERILQKLKKSGRVT